jgi:hypothetical protein
VFPNERAVLQKLACERVTKIERGLVKARATSLMPMKHLLMHACTHTLSCMFWFADEVFTAFESAVVSVGGSKLLCMFIPTTLPPISLGANANSSA